MHGSTFKGEGRNDWGEGIKDQIDDLCFQREKIVREENCQARGFWGIESNNPSKRFMEPVSQRNRETFLEVISRGALFTLGMGKQVQKVL